MIFAYLFIIIIWSILLLACFFKDFKPDRFTFGCASLFIIIYYIEKIITLIN